MSKHIGYYLSQKSSINLAPIDTLTPESKIDLARALLNLANLRTGQMIEGMVLAEQIAKMTAADPRAIEGMGDCEKIRLAGAVLITACDEMAIEREEAIACGENAEVSTDEFLIA